MRRVRRRRDRRWGRDRGGGDEDDEPRTDGDDDTRHPGTTVRRPEGSTVRTRMSDHVASFPRS